MKKILFLTLIFTNILLAREIGQTEITTEEGIEVFQNEKYYLLKKNVIIVSDDFELKADLVKAFFDKDLYDITKIKSQGNVILKSSKGLIAKGDKIDFSTRDENIFIFGQTSYLKYNEINMFSNKQISVNNLTGEFNLDGPKSKLITDTIEISGEFIDGRYINVDNANIIEKLFVKDKNKANIKTDKINMFSLKANYNKKDNIIELFDEVEVIRDNETIKGDYAKINTLTESYKVTSKNTNEKVKVLINKKDE